MWLKGRKNAQRTNSIKLFALPIQKFPEEKKCAGSEKL